MCGGRKIQFRILLLAMCLVTEQVIIDCEHTRVIVVVDCTSL